MLSKEKIFKLYEKYNVRATKKFGQNFIHDTEIIKTIVKMADIDGKNVIEIGPGLGSLTIELLKKAKTVIAYEIDNEMYSVLKSEIKADNLQLKLADFLSESFSWKNKVDVVANIPYNITSPILFKIFKSIEKFSTATLMIQKEVAERLIAVPNQKSYGKLSVTSQILANIEKVIDVPASSFIPAPKVDSVVVKITFKKDKYDSNLMDFVKLSFSQQRKKLTNNLKTKHDPTKIIGILNDLKISKDIRPQQLSVENFIEIYNKL